MKKIILVLFVILLFLSCGIENYVYLEPIPTPSSIPNDALDEVNNYLYFRLPNSINSINSPNEFLGYEIYYKIYNYQNIKNSDVNSINNYNENNPTLIYNYLVNTKKYHRLASIKRENNYPLIPKSVSDKYVYLRISSFTEANGPNILVGNIDISLPDSPLIDGERFGSPLRTKDGITNIDDLDYTFSYEKIKKNEDFLDYEFAEDIDSDYFYVQFYGFTYGKNFGVYSIHSSATNLGSLTLKK